VLLPYDVLISDNKKYDALFNNYVIICVLSWAQKYLEPESPVAGHQQTERVIKDYR